MLQSALLHFGRVARYPDDGGCMTDRSTAKELMIDVFEYPHLPYWFTIKQAVGVIRKSLIKTDKCVHPKVIFVFDEKYNLIGYLPFEAILRGLESIAAPAAAADTDASLVDEAALARFKTGLLGGEAKQYVEKPISEVMVPIRAFLSPDDSVVKAARLMLHHNSMALPVLENNQKFVGVVRMMDVFDEIFTSVLQAK
jgi:Mg/Co/Ni transporter MgtE